MKRCLVVDDEEQNRYLLECLLKGNGYDAVTAANGAEALEKARAHPPDLVITDVLMPVMDGFALCKAWKSDEQLRCIPLIIYTATYTDQNDEAFALSLGADRYLIKPQDPEVLLVELGKLLNQAADTSWVAAEQAIGENDFLKRHYEAVVRKLDDKIIELERLNTRLIEEIADKEKAQAFLEQEKLTSAEAENKYRQIFEGAVEGIFQTTPQGRYLGVNPAFARMFGYASADEMMAQVVSIGRQLYVHAEDRDRLKAVLADQGYVTGFETEVRRKDGSTFWISINAHSIRDATGVVQYYEGTNTDITDRKRVEEELRKLNEALEQRVRDRTAQLEAVNQELESFSYSVSHDLRAPLRSIDGFSRILLEDYYPDRSLDETGRSYLERIRKAVHHMGQLIEDLLKLSRISRVEYRKSPIDLSRMVKDLAERFRQNMPDRMVEVIVEAGIVMNGDASLMEIALVNMLDNAWKFTGKTSHPRIEFGKTQKDGMTVCYLRDNGAGFDPQYANKLFGAFQRLHAPEEFPGTGIGLATVKRIINRHGGRIWAEGEVGKGATFYFMLHEA